MIAPLAGVSLRAIVWYQGEANSGASSAPYYGCQLAAMLTSWRTAWGGRDIPFVYVQLAPEYPSAWPDYSFFEIRVQQASLLSAPAGKGTSGMVVAIDCGDATSPYPPSHVHTRRKRVISDRAASLLLRMAYDIPSGPAWGGPVPTSSVLAGDSVVITFSPGDGETAPTLTLAPTPDCWECCTTTMDNVQVAEEAGAQATWVNATVSLKGDVLTVTPRTTGAWAWVRGWPSTAPQCALYNAAGLPASPFLMAVSPQGGGHKQTAFKA